MDKGKMAEGRRLASEKRRQEAAEKEAELEKHLEEQAKRLLEPSTIQEFETLRAQVKTFYDEISILSKKTPDGMLNKFKLKFLNDVLVKVNTLLGSDHRPFSDFESFDDHELPSASDAVLILSHYLVSMSHYFYFHTYEEGPRERKWHTKGADPLEAHILR